MQEENAKNPAQNFAPDSTFAADANLNPQGKPIYRLLTGIDDKNFCLKVSSAIAEGYELYGSPALAFNGQNVIAAQAVIWKKAVIK